MINTSIKFSNGNKAWYLNGKFHREDGPAVERSDGSKEWYLNGLLHREDGPAREWSNGYKAWYLNGKRHREDGPAAEWGDGNKAWHLHGKLHREDGPAIEYASGYKEWWVNGERMSILDILNNHIVTDKRYWDELGANTEISFICGTPWLMVDLPASHEDGPLRISLMKVENGWMCIKGPAKRNVVKEFVEGSMA